MPRAAKQLSDQEVRALEAPGMYAVGGQPGLMVQVSPVRQLDDGDTEQAKSWVLRAMIGGKRRDMGLGGYPAVLLSAARRAAREARETIRNGGDPIEERRALKSALKAGAAKVITFEEAAKAYIATHEASWDNAKHRQQWENTLKTYAYPTIGSLSVRHIELVHVLSVLEPIWHKRTETAKRLRGRIEKVLGWATSRGHRDGLNPARWRDHLDQQLASPSKIAKPKHHAALPFDEMSNFITKLREAQGMGARALEFVILTAARSGEVRGATWSELDIAAKEWTVPAARMKMRKEHRVPLSPAALDLLRALPRVAGSDLVFPAPQGGSLSDMTLTAVLRRMDVPATAHGFRSSFRDWAAEKTNYPRDAVEMALAHAIGDKVEAAYRRGDLFEKRCKMMNDWAKFCGVPLVSSGARTSNRQARA